MHLYRSDKLEALVATLGEIVAAPLSSPFVPETIVVPSRALGAWLGLRLAELHGVWANPRFVTADAFLDALHGSVLPSGPHGEDALTKDVLGWSIAAALPRLLAHPAFGEVAAYLADDTDTTKRVAFARKLAGVFQAYLLYRPELVAAWERGTGSDEESSECTVAAWQSVLWRALPEGHGHRASRNAALLEALQSGAPGAIAGLPERVSVFVPGSAPAIVLDVLGALAKHIPVHVLVRRGDHPLAESLGTRGRDLAAALLEREGVVEPPLATVPAAPTAHGAATVPTATAKPSIAFHACHAPMRECEVLRDQLLAAMDEDRTLEARDVLVLCPDLETYAPVIDAVFGIPQRDQGYLPYRIVDRSERKNLVVVEGFLALLDLAPSRMAATAVVDLLAREPIREKFALEENEIDIVRRWVTECGIRWGEDEAHRRDVGQPAFRANTWRFGLDRLVLGYAMHGRDGEGHALCEGCLPYDDIEGTTTATLGGLASFSEQLFTVRKQLVGLAPLAAWRDRLKDALRRLFAAPWQTELQHQMIRGALDELARRGEAAGFTDEVPLTVVRDALAADLDDRASALEHSPGGITFASFDSARCVPARVVVMLGMNDGTFPRAPRKDAFDLVASRPPRRGDPSCRDEDRQAFLDALLSARDRLIVTYVGQSIANNGARPPSVVVSELLDFLDSTSATAEQRITSHALHAFSPTYFGERPEDPRFFSHAAALCKGAQSMRAPSTELPPFVRAPLPPVQLEGSRAVNLDALVRFFEHPVRAFMNERLGVFLGRDLTPLEDREPLTFDPLERWKLGTELLDRMRAGEDIHELPPDVLASGALPLGVVGRLAYDELVPDVVAIGSAALPLLDAARPAPREIDIEIGGTRIAGWLRNIGAKAHVGYTFSKLHGKHRIGAWIRHLVMQCAGLERDTWMIGRDTASAVCLAYRRVADPRAVLESLVELYWRGLEAPLLFFADPSLEYADWLPRRGHDYALGKARASFEGEYGISRCPYVKKAFGERDPFGADFEPFGTPRDRKRFPSFTDLALYVGAQLLQHEEKVT